MGGVFDRGMTTFYPHQPSRLLRPAHLPIGGHTPGVHNRPEPISSLATSTLAAAMQRDAQRSPQLTLHAADLDQARTCGLLPRAPPPSRADNDCKPWYRAATPGPTSALRSASTQTV